MNIEFNEDFEKVVNGVIWLSDNYWLSREYNDQSGNSGYGYWEWCYYPPIPDELQANPVPVYYARLSEEAAEKAYSEWYNKIYKGELKDIGVNRVEYLNFEFCIWIEEGEDAPYFNADGTIFCS